MSSGALCRAVGDQEFRCASGKQQARGLLPRVTTFNHHHPLSFQAIENPLCQLDGHRTHGGAAR